LEKVVKSEWDHRPKQEVSSNPYLFEIVKIREHWKHQKYLGGLFHTPAAAAVAIFTIQY